MKGYFSAIYPNPWPLPQCTSSTLVAQPPIGVPASDRLGLHVHRLLNLPPGEPDRIDPGVDDRGASTPRAGF